jgi:hypothetical protein
VIHAMRHWTAIQIIRRAFARAISNDRNLRLTPMSFPHSRKTQRDACSRGEEIERNPPFCRMTVQSRVRLPRQNDSNDEKTHRKSSQEAVPHCVSTVLPDRSVRRGIQLASHR